MVRMRHIYSRVRMSGNLLVVIVEVNATSLHALELQQVSFLYVTRPFSFSGALTYTGCYCLSAPLFYYLNTAQVITCYTQIIL